ncbi:MAG: conjugal transfer protein TraN [Zetaproteobacteria bacterium]|nr:MAG: conjugal transfer protein TraN [Zetaproteobacteria bacterium]
MRGWAWVAIWCACGSAWAGAVQDARSFAAGQNLPGVAAGARASDVPGFQGANPPQTGLAANPSALSGQAAAADPAGAASFVRNSAASRPQFTITAQDPLLRGAAQVRKNAKPWGASSVQGCTAATVTVPAVVDTYTCTRSTYAQPVSQTLVLDRYARAYQQALDAYTQAWNAYQAELNKTPTYKYTVSWKYQKNAFALVHYYSYTCKSNKAPKKVSFTYSRCYQCSPGICKTISIPCLPKNKQVSVSVKYVDPGSLVQRRAFTAQMYVYPLHSSCQTTDTYTTIGGPDPALLKKYRQQMAQAMQRMLDAVRAAQNARGAPPNPRCVLVGRQCLDNYASVTLNGQTVTPCWRWRENYRCPATADACAPYAKAGCAQVSSTCVRRLPDGSCGETQATYRCQSQPARKLTQTICGTMNVCVQGQCLNTASTPSADFLPSVARLMALHAAGASIGATNPPRIFQGRPASCNVTIASLKNCCRQGTGGCPQGAQRLWQAMAARRTHYVGADCAVKDPIFGTCLRKRHWYCVFGSKLGRIVQEQGRVQLGIGWGAPPNPNCRGLTPSELQRLDFSRMDLSEFHADILAQMKTLQAGRLKRRISNRIQNYYQSGASSGGLVR